MSSKIDGVPRKLLERLHEIICGDGHHEEGELGNLLDAPVVERQPVEAPVVGKLVQNGPGYDCWHPNANQGQAVVLQTDHVECIAKLQATIARLTAENDRLKGGQAEPSLWCVRVPDEPEDPEESPAEYHYAGSEFELGKLLESPGSTVIQRYFTSQPAPVSVLLPERMQYLEADGDETIATKDAWNACLDKVKELNQRTVPETFDVAGDADELIKQ